MCLPHVFLRLLRVEWKANHLDKSLKQKSTVRRIFLKIAETNLTREKYAKVKIFERVLCVITFTCKRFLTFQCFILKFNRKVQSPRVPSFGVLSLGSRVLGPGVLRPGSQLLGPHFRLCRLYGVWTILFVEKIDKGRKRWEGGDEGEMERVTSR